MEHNKISNRQSKLNVSKTHHDKFNQSNLLALINNTQDLMWSVDRNYKLITSNKSFDAMVQHLIGQSIAKGSNTLAVGVTAEPLTRYKKLYDRAFAGEKFTVTEYTDSPVVYWSELSFHPIRIGNEIVGTACYAHDTTESKLAKEKIEHNEKYFRALVENSTDLVVLTDKSGIITYVSPSHGKLTGCTAEEVIGKFFYSFQHPAHVAELKKQFDELLAHPGIPMPRVSRFRQHGGGYIWVEGTVTNLLHDPAVGALVGNFRDITKRKLAEEKIINTQRLYEFISQINQTITHTTDEATLFHKACNIAVDIGKFGLCWIAVPDIQSKSLRVIAHNSSAIAGDITALENLKYDDNGPTANVLRSGRYFVINDFSSQPVNTSSYIYAFQRGYNSLIVLPVMKSGLAIATFNLLSERVGLFDEQEIRLLKEAAGDISYALDVFEKDKHRKKLEDETAHSKLRLAQAQSIARLGSWDLDFSSGTGKWSDEACRIYGISPKDNVHSYQSWLSFVHPDDLDYVLQVIKEGERTISSSAFDHRIMLKNGEIKHICTESHFEFNSEGKPVGLYGIAQDVTRSKELEIERAKITADIVQRNNDLEQFSYIVSHNLRAPVANIIGLVNVRQTIGINIEEETFITEGLSKAAQNLDTVIKDINHILDLKHVVNEKRVIIRLEDLLAEVKLSIGNCINNDSIRIISNISEAEEITTIKSYLYSIFFNLISNSIKYKRSQIPAIIEVTAVKTDNKILLNFKDNGLGIDLEKKGEYVFGLYKRFHYHTEGKGMGLFTVKTQVEALGGKITIVSEVNRGSEFKIEFEIGKNESSHNHTSLRNT